MIDITGLGASNKNAEHRVARDGVIQAELVSAVEQASIVNEWMVNGT